MLQAHNAAPSLMVRPIQGQTPTSELGISQPQNSAAPNIIGTMRGRWVAIGAFITKVFGDVGGMRMIDAMLCEKSRYKGGKCGGFTLGEDDLKSGASQVTYR